MMSISRASARLQTGHRAARATSNAKQLVLVGALALAVGVLLGYAPPSTEAEDQQLP
jgi:hypothetical protein